MNNHRSIQGPRPEQPQWLVPNQKRERPSQGKNNHKTTRTSGTWTNASIQDSDEDRSDRIESVQASPWRSSSSRSSSRARIGDDSLRNLGNDNGRGNAEVEDEEPEQEERSQQLLVRIRPSSVELINHPIQTREQNLEQRRWIRGRKLFQHHKNKNTRKHKHKPLQQQQQPQRQQHDVMGSTKDFITTPTPRMVVDPNGPHSVPDSTPGTRHSPISCLSTDKEPSPPPRFGGDGARQKFQTQQQQDKLPLPEPLGESKTRPRSVPPCTHNSRYGFSPRTTPTTTTTTRLDYRQWQEQSWQDGFIDRTMDPILESDREYDEAEGDTSYTENKDLDSTVQEDTVTLLDYLESAMVGEWDSAEHLCTTVLNHAHQAAVVSVSHTDTLCHLPRPLSTVRVIGDPQPRPHVPVGQAHGEFEEKKETQQQQQPQQEILPRRRLEDCLRKQDNQDNGDASTSSSMATAYSSDNGWGLPRPLAWVATHTGSTTTLTPMAAKQLVAQTGQALWDELDKHSAVWTDCCSESEAVHNSSHSSNSAKETMAGQFWANRLGQAVFDLAAQGTDALEPYVVPHWPEDSVDELSLSRNMPLLADAALYDR